MKEAQCGASGWSRAEARLERRMEGGERRRWRTKTSLDVGGVRR